MNIFYLCCLLLPLSLNGVKLTGLKMSTEKANIGTSLNEINNNLYHLLLSYKK